MPSDNETDIQCIKHVNYLLIIITYHHTSIGKLFQRTYQTKNEKLTILRCTISNGKYKQQNCNFLHFYTYIMPVGR